MFQIDPGVSANILPLCYDKCVLKMWKDSKFHTVGTFSTTVRNPRNRKKYSVEFLVYDGSYMPILGLKASEAMGLVKVTRLELRKSFASVY